MAIPGQKGQGEEQAGDELAAHIPGQRIVPGSQGALEGHPGFVLNKGQALAVEDGPIGA